MGKAALFGILLGAVGLTAVFVLPWVGVVIPVLAFIAALLGVLHSGTHAGALPGEEPPETMAHMRGPGI